MSGSNTANQPSFTGTLGLTAAGNGPGGRIPGARWTDNSGNLWMFGGSPVPAGSVSAYLNDLWKFSPTTNEWAWMGGNPNASGQSGIYGTLGTPSAGNLPGSRNQATSWTDSKGNFWLFGGYGYDANGNLGALNDMWVYQPAITAAPAVPSITWSQPAPVVYGTAISASQLNATASVTGTYSYSPALGTVLGAGTRTLSVTFIPSDTADYTATMATVALQVNPAPLTVTANNLSSVVGASLPALTASYNGFTNGDTSAVLSGSPTLSTTATSSSAAGIYPISVAKGTLTAANYTFNLVNGSLAVSAAPTPTLTTSATLSLANGGYTASVTINNSGKGAASNVLLTTATLGSAAATTALPLNLGTISAGNSTTVVINFPASAGTPGAASTDKFAGTYTGGSFSSSSRVVLP